MLSQAKFLVVCQKYWPVMRPLIFDEWLLMLHRSHTVWYGSRKGTIQKYFANPKNISNQNIFFKITVEKFDKSKKLLQILRKLVDPQITFSIIGKYFAMQIHKNYFKSQFLYKSLLKSLANRKKQCKS